MIKGSCNSYPPLWFDDFEEQVQKIYQALPTRSSCNSGVGIPILIPYGGHELTWKLLDEIYPFVPKDIEIRVSEDGKSVGLNAKSERTAYGGGKVSHVFRKQWAWTDEIDPKNLTCYITDDGVFIEVSHENVASKSSEATAKPHGTVVIPIIISNNGIDSEKAVECASEGPSSTDLKAESDTKTDICEVTQKQTTTAVTKKALNYNVRASIEDDMKDIDTESLSKVKALKEISILIKKVNVSVSEYKLKTTNQRAKKQVMKVQNEKVPTTPVRPTDLPIALNGKTDSSLLLVDIDGYLNLFDENLLPYERQFWERRSSALRLLKKTSGEYDQKSFQTLHWSSVLDDFRILQSNLGEISKELDLVETTSTEFKVVLDVAGVSLENLSVSMPDGSRLIVEAQWRSGFEYKCTKREWDIPQVFSNTDVKCIMSSDEILLIVIKVNVTSE